MVFFVFRFFAVGVLQWTQNDRVEAVGLVRLRLDSTDRTSQNKAKIAKKGYVPPLRVSTRLDPTRHQFRPVMFPPGRFRLDSTGSRPRPVALVERASTHLDWSKKVEAKKASTPFDSFRLESSCAETWALVATFCAKQPLKCISVSSCNQVAHAANSRWSGGMPLTT